MKSPLISKFIFMVALCAFSHTCVAQVIIDQSYDYQLPDVTYETGEEVILDSGSYVQDSYIQNSYIQDSYVQEDSYIQDSYSQPIGPGQAAAMPMSFDFFGFNTPYSSRMLDFQNRQGDKDLFILENAFESEAVNSMTIGMQFRASGLFATTNEANKFPYQGRFPTDFTGDSATDFRLLQANQSVTVDVNRIFHGHIETLFSDVFTFSTFQQGSYQVRQAYIVLGDLSRSPFYAHIGKKNVSFGDMRSLSPFTQSMPWHYFAPLGEGAGIGVDNGRFNGTFTVLNGSRGIRVVDSEEQGKLNNFAANGRLSLDIGSRAQLDLGGGYLHGTIYNAAVAEHTDATIFGENNGAWDVNALLRVGRLQLFGEYVQTVNAWPATGHEVVAYSGEAAIETFMFGKPGRLSLSWSEGIQGQEDTEFEFNRQIVAGYLLQAHPNAAFSVEYVRSSGFAPLVAIQAVSDKSVIQDSLVFGARISL